MPEKMPLYNTAIRLAELIVKRDEATGEQIQIYQDQIKEVSVIMNHLLSFDERRITNLAATTLVAEIKDKERIF